MADILTQAWAVTLTMALFYQVKMSTERRDHFLLPIPFYTTQTKCHLLLWSHHVFASQFGSVLKWKYTFYTKTPEGWLHTSIRDVSTTQPLTVGKDHGYAKLSHYCRLLEFADHTLFSRASFINPKCFWPKSQLSVQKEPTCMSDWLLTPH